MMTHALTHAAWWSLPGAFLLLSGTASLLSLAAGCASVSPIDVTTPAAEPTVLVLTFQTPSEASVVVEFGETSTFGYTTPATVGTEHQHTLLGMPADTEVHFRLVVDGEALEEHTASTGLLPADLPALTTVEDGATWDGWLFTTLVGVWQGPVVLDRHGRIVWFYDDPRGPTSVVVRARPLLDGSGISYNTVAGGEDKPGTIFEVSWDGSPIRSLGVPGQSHDFLETTPGTYASIQLAPRVDGETTIQGDRLVEVSAEGIRVLYDTWDWIDEAAAEEDFSRESWTHANSLHWLPDEGVYRMGMRDLETIATLDAASGEPLDYFGGEVNDGWVIEDDERAFSHQHNFQWTADRLLIFDNGLSAYNDSRVVEYALDPSTKTATRTWSRHFDPPRWIYALGDVERLDDESTLISWSVAGRLEQVKGDETVWRVEAPVGTGFGYIARTPSLYPVAE